MKKLCCSLIILILIFTGCSANASISKNGTSSDAVTVSGTNWPKIDKNNAQSMNIATMLFGSIDTTDKKQISTVANYLNSLTVSETDTYGGMGDGNYNITIKFKDNTERTLELIGNQYFIEKNHFHYKVPYDEAIKFDTIFADILQEKAVNNGESSVEGTVASVNSEESGHNLSCIIKNKDGKSYNIDVNKAKIIDSTGHGNLMLYNNDEITVFYQEKNSPNTITAESVFIKYTTK